jgi:uracil-DNA glycosylase
MKVLIEQSWNKILKHYLETKQFKKLWDFIVNQYKNKTIYPHQKDLFHAFKLTPFDKVSVVILGQDPYHGPDQANGLSFSVPEKITPPPSLKNIYREIESDIRTLKDFTNGSLQPWAKQGVLLLNSVLTVEEDNPGSHAGYGWEEFTDYIIQKVSNERNHVVFLLWGNYAKKKGSIINRSKHLVLESSHPSPLGAYRGFKGSKHFSQTNNYLEKNNKEKINW